MPKLNKEQWFLLEWLSKEDSSAYGECHGTALDSLSNLGMIEMTPMIAGQPEEYRRVFLSDYGWEVINDAHLSVDSVGRN